MNKAYSTDVLEEVERRLQNCTTGELDEALEFWDSISDADDLLIDPELITYADTICKIIRQLRRIRQIKEEYSTNRMEQSAKELSK